MPVINAHLASLGVWTSVMLAATFACVLVIAMFGLAEDDAED